MVQIAFRKKRTFGTPDLRAGEFIIQGNSIPFFLREEDYKKLLNIGFFIKPEEWNLPDGCENITPKLHALNNSLN